MNKIMTALLVAGIAIYSVAMPTSQKSGIQGMIDPPEGAKKVWAINGNDSVQTIPVAGNFSMEVKPGTWKIVIEAVKPYRNREVSNIFVQENQSTDAGVIQLISENQ